MHMNNNRNVPKLVERRLLCESVGYCMNPCCEENLFATDTFNGEKAHIKPHADGGDTSFENLIMLCRRCHNTVDAQRSFATEPMLLRWKQEKGNENRKRFAAVYATFEELVTHVRPILQNNLAIFRSYGPGGGPAEYSRAHALWLQFEEQLIVNNQKLVHLLTANSRLMHKENRKIVDKFLLHHQEFVHTRENQLNERINLFPAELNSMFATKRIETTLAPFVSPLQNLIAKLDAQDRYVGLELIPEPILTYLEGGETVHLYLADRPRVQQMYWDWKCYQPQTTGVRLRSLIYVRDWLSKRRCTVQLRSNANLVDVVVSSPLYGRAHVFFCEKYCVSLEDIYQVPDHDGLIMVNLHGWNNGPFSPEAVQHAIDIGVRTMNQTQFFAFIRGGLQ